MLGPFIIEFWPLPALLHIVMITIYFGQRMYQRRRPVTHLDELIRITTYNILATLVTVALLASSCAGLTTWAFILLGAALVVVCDTFLRTVHAQLQWQAQARGMVATACC